MSLRTIPITAVFILTQSAFVAAFVLPGAAHFQTAASVILPQADSTIQPLHSGSAQEQLQRLEADTGNTRSAQTVDAAHARERQLRTATLTVTVDVVSTGSVVVPKPWIIRVADHPEWVVPALLPTGPTYAIDEKQIALAFDSIVPDSIPRPQFAVAQTSDDDNRLVILSMPRSGFAFDVTTASHAIAEAISSGTPMTVVSATYQTASLLVSTESGVQQYDLLSSGLSNFADSPPGRDANVRKALDENLNGWIIPADTDFSFNRTLLGSRGWHNSYVIRNGKDLVMEPGGGICQAATTLYRAALLAGLPIVARANHSLYVAHYKDYGVGVDATVYAPKQDLKVHNDTGHPIIILARHEGDDAYVDFYGVPDGRTVSMEGPYFSKTTPSLAFKGHPLRINQIGWKQHIAFADGHVVSQDIVSTYQVLPRTLYSEYLNPKGTDELRMMAVVSITGSLVTVR